MKATSFAALLIAPLLATTVAAGDYPTVPHRWGWYWGGHGASTVGESTARGQAALLRAAGEFNLLNSHAALVREDARARYIDNRVNAVQARYDMKRINREYHEATRRPRVTLEQAARLAEQAAPDRATSYQVDPVTGELYWPAVLRDDCFSANRQQLEQLFAARQATDAPDGRIFADIKEVTGEMTELLKTRIRSCDPTSYLAAKEFLRSLAYEARFAPVQADVASR